MGAPLLITVPHETNIPPGITSWPPHTKRCADKTHLFDRKENYMKQKENPEGKCRKVRGLPLLTDTILSRINGTMGDIFKDVGIHLVEHLERLLV